MYNVKNYTEQGGEVTHIDGTLAFGSAASVTGMPASALPAATATAIGGVKVAANQVASEATTIATLKEDFNALLTKLKAAGLMVADTAST